MAVHKRLIMLMIVHQFSILHMILSMRVSKRIDNVNDSLRIQFLHVIPFMTVDKQIDNVYDSL